MYTIIMKLLSELAACVVFIVITIVEWFMIFLARVIFLEPFALFIAGLMIAAIVFGFML